MKKTMRCTNCGKTFELETGKNYCPECGSVLWSRKFLREGIRSTK